MCIRDSLKAVDNDDANAMFNLAVLYENEFKDFKKAEKFYLKAVDNDDANAMFNLAVLYENEFNNLEKAEKFYQKAINKDHTYAMSSMAYYYFDKNLNKLKALELATKAYRKKKDDLTSIPYAISLVWNNKIGEYSNVANQFLFNEELLTEKFIAIVESFLFLVLAKKEYTFLYNYFESKKANSLNLKEKLKPIWYTLMYYMQDVHPNEYLRMGEELAETVKEIVEKVEQMRIDYA